MGLFNNDIPGHPWHAIRRRSWWDGSVVAYCGQRAPAGTYDEAWFAGNITCTGCQKEMKKEDKK